MSDTRRATAEQIVRDWQEAYFQWEVEPLHDAIHAALDAAYQQGREDERREREDHEDNDPRWGHD